jgi:hypothetical protein
MLVVAAAAGGHPEQEHNGGEPGDAHSPIVADACSRIVRSG